MSHQIMIETEVEIAPNLPEHLRQVIAAALVQEAVQLDCEVNVLITDNAGIQEINLSERGIDAPTDVLSFPMFDLAPGTPPQGGTYLDPGTGLMPLGDMVLSLERAQEQALEYGHSLLREISYLTVHSVLHLLGYDHLDEGEMKRQMRGREEQILNLLKLDR